MRQATFKLFGCLMILAITAIFANAQFKAGIQGTVTDNAGAIVSGATVTLTNKETNQSQQTQSSDGGFYRFSGLAPGLYTVTVEKENFKKQVVEDVTINAETLEGVNVSLQAGGVSETVTVTADPAPLETEDANIRKTITTQEVLNLPQNGRNPYELARLTPGVFGNGARSANGEGTRLPNTSGPGGSSNSIFATEDRQPISANGQRVSSNNYQIDGSSVNSQTWGGGAVITPSQESVKEVQITSSTYSAEDGRNSGAQIKVVSQNGTNQFRGSAFFKIDDPSLNSFNKLPRNISGGPARVEQKYKTYGGSFGGRIIRNRLFFFFAYEGLTSNSNNTYTSFVETSAYRQAVIAARPNTLTARVLGDAGAAPRIVSILTPSCSELSGDVSNGCVVVGNGLDLGRITGAYGTYVQFFNTGGAPVGGGLDGIADLQKVLLANSTKFRGNQYNTRIDYNITSKDQFTVSSYIVPNTATNSDTGAQSRPMADITSKRLSYALGFIYRRTFSSTMLNEARFNVTRWGFDETKTNPNSNFGLPRIEIESLGGDRLRYGAAYGINTPGIINERQFEFRDIFTNVIGNHALRIGGEIRRDLNSNGEVGAARPLYSFKGLWNFANGTPIFEQIVANQQGKPTANNTKFHTGDLGLFVQDDWKFRPNLTLNMGLRWDYFSPITADSGVIGNLILGPTGGLTGAKISTQKSVTESNYKNFAPQLGFAWSPNWLGESKLVIRGGGGIGFDRLPDALLANARRNPPNGNNFGICCGTNGTSDGFGTPFADGQIAYVQSGDGTIFGYPANPLIGGGTNPTSGLPNIGSIEIYGTPRKLPDATVYRYSLEGQYQLPANLVATVGYQGSQGRHFVRILPIHITVPGSNPNIFAAYFASPDVNSNYNAMITRLQGRLLKQVSFDMNYRWAKSIDTASYESPTSLTNQSFPVDQREERGPSDFDVRHAFVASATWEPSWFKGQKNIGGDLLSGWSISPIVTWNSGFPWTPKLFGCLQQVNTPANFCDPRPTRYFGAQPLSNSNANFLQPGGVFPGGGATYFNTEVPFNANPFTQRPGIGRNVFRGPRYFDVDMSISKKFGLSKIGFLGESANVDVRFNFFNIFNTLNLTPFNSGVDSTRVTSPNFGRATSALAGRVGEFQIRFSF
jgi:Carboxypeptidase regulatory-like domain/TonB dependent receptor